MKMDPRCMKMDPGWMNLYSKHEPKLEFSLKNHDFYSKLDKSYKLDEIVGQIRFFYFYE